MTDESEANNSSDPYENELYSDYTETSIIEMQSLMTYWDRATYPILATSIVKHAKKHGFAGESSILEKSIEFQQKRSA